MNTLRPKSKKKTNVPNIFHIIAWAFLIYIILQALYSGFYLYQGSKLSAESYPRKTSLGEKGNQIKLFITGDSVAVGLGSSTFDKSISGRIAYYLAESNKVSFQNESISGARMEKLLTMQTPTEKQDVLIIIASSNDVFKFTPIDSFKKSTEEVVTKYSAYADKIIIVGPGRVYDGEAVPFFLRMIYKQRSPEYVEVLTTIAKENPKVIYVNPTNPDFYKGSYGPTTAQDKFHPNDEGHRLWFDLIKPTLN